MVTRLFWPTAIKLRPGVWLVADPKVRAQHVWLCGVLLGVGWTLTSGLTREELWAVAAHERGHRWHPLIRGLCTLLRPSWLSRLVHYQEFLADGYAKRSGHGATLASALLKLDPDDRSSGNLYPLTSERIARLLA